MIFGTPSATPPAWLTKKYPEVLNARMEVVLRFNQFQGVLNEYKKEAPTPRLLRKIGTPSVHPQGLEPWTPCEYIKLSYGIAKCYMVLSDAANHLKTSGRLGSDNMK